MTAAFPTRYLPRDFVQVEPGLFFAVVDYGLELGRVPCCLRYVRAESTLRKVRTFEAYEWLRTRHPEYLFDSLQRDVQLHGVLVEKIAQHHQPRQRLAELLQADGGHPMEQKACHVARLLGADGQGDPMLGVTGSLLIGAQHERSDIDLVYYDPDEFQQGRERVQALVDSGHVQPLDDVLWRETFERRGCCMGLNDYVWHERRKWNKFVFQGTKVDISWVSQKPLQDVPRGSKEHPTRILATVVDDRDAFAYPARYQIDHCEIQEILSYNPTFTGQAQSGEQVEAVGWIERLEDGRRRLFIGTSRESEGESLRVVRG